MEWQKALNNAHLLVQFPHSYMNLKLLRSVYVIVLISLHKMVISSNKRDNKPTNTVVSLSLVLQKIWQDDLAESPKVDQEADQDTKFSLD